MGAFVTTTTPKEREEIIADITDLETYLVNLACQAELKGNARGKDRVIKWAMAVRELKQISILLERPTDAK